MRRDGGAKPSSHALSRSFFIVAVLAMLCCPTRLSARPAAGPARIPFVGTDARSEGLFLLDPDQVRPLSPAPDTLFLSRPSTSWRLGRGGLVRTAYTVTAARAASGVAHLTTQPETPSARCWQPSRGPQTLASFSLTRSSSPKPPGWSVSPHLRPPPRGRSSHRIWRQVREPAVRVCHHCGTRERRWSRLDRQF